MPPDAPGSSRSGSGATTPGIVAVGIDDGGRVSDQFELADVFAEVARALLSEDGAEATLDRICRLAVETIETCEHAGITLNERNRLRSVAATDDVPRAADAVQDETQEGPCVDAIREQEVFVTGKLLDEERWPNFARRAHADSGIESVMSFRLYADAETFGALNLYSKKREAFGEDDLHLGSIFSAHAAVAFSAMQQQQHLEAALVARDTIGRAKGILMARSGLTDEEAFDVLRQASQRMNLKLREVAERVGRSSNPPAG